MRILGIDYGKVRIGLSLSDSTGVVAYPLTVLTNKPDITSRIKQIALQHSVRKIVVGLPLNMNGSQGEMASAAQHLAFKLREDTGLPVEMIDERLTSWEAEEILKEAGLKRKKRKKLSDKIAATLILQKYLESKRDGNSG
jgi:putative Holliday junction resolvase